jgi:hypothetical protein
MNTPTPRSRAAQAIVDRYLTWKTKKAAAQKTTQITQTKAVPATK